MEAGLLGVGAEPGFGAVPGLGAVLGFEVGEEAGGAGDGLEASRTLPRRCRFGYERAFAQIDQLRANEASRYDPGRATPCCLGAPSLGHPELRRLLHHGLL